MMIASKYEEVKPPTIEDYVFITDRTYIREELLRMELHILNVLNFSLTVTTVRDFVGIFLKADSASVNVRMLADYLVELTLQDYAMMRYTPSIVGASATRLALFTVTKRCWSQSLTLFSRAQQCEVVKCMQEILRVWQCAPQNTLQAVREKFSRTRHMCVATHYQPPAQLPV
jgi:cyclin A